MADPEENTSGAPSEPQTGADDSGPSVRESLMAALQEHAAQPAGESTEAAELPASTSEPAGTDATQAAAPGQPRGADGKFAEKPAATAATPAVAATTPKSPDQAPAPAGVAPTTGEPPATWSAAAKAEWQKATPAIQAEVLKRERDFAEGMRSQAERYKPAVEFTTQALALLKPHAESYRAQGMNEAQAVGWLVSMHEFFQRDPKAYAREICKAAGLVLAEGQSAPAASAPANGAAPTESPLLHQALQKISNLENHVTAAQRAQHEAARKQDVGTVDAFAKQAGADGKLLRPHFDAVREDMVRIANTLPDNVPFEQALTQAYEAAIWANPQVRAQILAERDQTAASKSQTRNAQAAERARRAATPTVGNPGGANNADMPDDLRGSLKAAFRQHNAA